MKNNGHPHPIPVLHQPPIASGPLEHMIGLIMNNSPLDLHFAEPLVFQRAKSNRFRYFPPEPSVTFAGKPGRLFGASGNGRTAFAIIGDDRSLNLAVFVGEVYEVQDDKSHLKSFFAVEATVVHALDEDGCFTLMRGLLLVSSEAIDKIRAVVGR